MRCPRCGLEMSSDRGTYCFRYGCPSCGWMHSTERDPAESLENGEFDISLSQCVVCWILGIPFLLLFVVGPYVLLLLARPSFVDKPLFHVLYWTAWPLYLLLSYLISSDRDDENQGYFGMLIPPPSHLGDGVKRAVHTLLILFLVPGKIIVAAALATPRYVACWFRLRAKNRRFCQEVGIREGR